MTLFDIAHACHNGKESFEELSCLLDFTRVPSEVNNYIIIHKN